jgi:hypothetical protein
VAWHLAASLAVLRAEVNERWPNRDRASDGTIGDANHSASTSDHNPNVRGSVNAVDIDKDGVNIAEIIAAAERHPSVHYWIYNRQIADRDAGFRRQYYSGPNPHDKHIHISIRQSATAENDRRPWGILEDDMTPADMTAWAKSDAGKKAIADAVWTADVDPTADEYSGAGALWTTFNRAGSAANVQLPAVAAAVSGIGAALQAIAASDHVDEQALAEALAPAVAAMVLTNLPQTSDQISQDEVNEAVKAAFRDAFAAS